MNIFYLSPNPKECAHFHNDKHVVKMILESTMLLFTCLHTIGYPMDPDDIKIYRPTHQNHPCSKWVAASIHHFDWLCQLGLELCLEYTHRYGKIHACQSQLIWLTLQLPTLSSYLPATPFVQPFQVMPKEYKHEDAVVAYRNYYIGAKRHFCTWKHRPVPKWFAIWIHFLQ